MITIESSTFALLEIDVAKVESVTLENEITEYPVEVGADKTDHIRPRQAGLVLSDCIVSNSPLGNLVDKRSATRADEARGRIEDLHRSREPVSVGTNLKRWDNMALERVEMSRDADTGHAAKFTLTFRQIELATNGRVTVRTSTPGAAKQVDLGTKASPYGPDLARFPGSLAASNIALERQRLPTALQSDQLGPLKPGYLKAHPNGIIGPVGPFE